jgi:uncharacterized protein (DUF433 family)
VPNWPKQSAGARRRDTPEESFRHELARQDPVGPAIHRGEPCIKDTRVPVSVLVGSVADGDTPGKIIEAWPELTPDDIKAALKFAAEAVANSDFVPFVRGSVGGG